MKKGFIGVFDSGFGGLSVLKSLLQILPEESFAYFADTAHLPYGNKTPEQIVSYSLESIERLEKVGLKLLILACHSSSIHAFSSIVHRFPFPVLNITEISLQEIQKHRDSHHLAFLATQATVDSCLYQKSLAKLLPTTKVTAVACPLFVPFIESESLDQPLLLESILKAHLAPLIHLTPTVDTLFLACTHYPLIQKNIERFFHPAPSIIDPSLACAFAVQKFLKQEGLEQDLSDPARLEFYVTSNPSRFQSIGKRFLSCLKEPFLCSKEESFL